MPHHHCCILGCRSDSRYTPRDGSPPLRFFCVPSITSKKALHSQWLEQIGRPDLIVSRNTRVCSRHFVDGRPTKDYPHPTRELECYPYKRSRVHTTVRPYPKVTTNNDALNHSSALPNKSPSSSPSNHSLKDESSQYQQYNYYNDDDVAVEIPETVIHEFKQTQTEVTHLDDKSTQTMGNTHSPRILWDYTCQSCQCKSATKPGFHFNRAMSGLLQSEPFSIDTLKHSEEKLQFYTGLQTHGAFQLLLEELRPKLTRRSLPCDENMCDLPLDDQLLMALMAQKLTLLPQDLAYRFHVTSRIVESVCSKWGPILERHATRALSSSVHL